MINVGPHPNIIGLFGSVFFDVLHRHGVRRAERPADLLKDGVCFPHLQYVRVGSDSLMVEQSAPKVEDENANLMMFMADLLRHEAPGDAQGDSS
ncbi:hypothetical protein Btru_073332 [Bulinus truncatus]|nr:hypothetical protein Btru_073332 [Bulinus truncatus]